METVDYQKYAAATLTNYPLKHRNHIRKIFLERKIACNDLQISMDAPNAVNISGLELNNQLTRCIEENPASLAVLEEWEFLKDYKYSVLFSVERFEDFLVAIEGNAESFKHEHAPLYNSIEMPQFMNMDDCIALLKFNRKFEAIHPQTAEEMFTRYPIVVAFHKKARIIEFRFDALKRFFMENTDSFYALLTDEICCFIREQYGFELIPLDLDFLRQHLQHATGNVRLIAQTMKMSNGSYAQLDAGNNEEYVLPFIGELRNLLTEYEGEFEKVPVLKDAFNQFIYEKEVTSDYPWIEVLWEKEIKTRSIQVKFTFNYCQKNYCLLQHYFNNALIGMERMNDVVRYIDEVRRNPQQ